MSLLSELGSSSSLSSSLSPTTSSVVVLSDILSNVLDNSPILFSGYLTKRGRNIMGLGGLWKPRFMVLTTTHLIYTDKQQKEIKGKFLVSDILSVSAASNKVKYNKIRFIIRLEPNNHDNNYNNNSNSMSFDLCCNTEAERNQWVKQLSKIISIELEKKQETIRQWKNRKELNKLLKAKEIAENNANRLNIQTNNNITVNGNGTGKTNINSNNISANANISTNNKNNNNHNILNPINNKPLNPSASTELATIPLLDPTSLPNHVNSPPVNIINDNLHQQQSSSFIGNNLQQSNNSKQIGFESKTAKSQSFNQNMNPNIVSNTQFIYNPSSISKYSPNSMNIIDGKHVEFNNFVQTYPNLSSSSSSYFNEFSSPKYNNNPPNNFHSNNKISYDYNNNNNNNIKGFYPNTFAGYNVNDSYINNNNNNSNIFSSFLLSTNSTSIGLLHWYDKRIDKANKSNLIIYFGIMALISIVILSMGQQSHWNWSFYISSSLFKNYFNEFELDFNSTTAQIQSFQESTSILESKILSILSNITHYILWSIILRSITIFCMSFIYLLYFAKKLLISENKGKKTEKQLKLLIKIAPFAILGFIGTIINWFGII